MPIPQLGGAIKVQSSQAMASLPKGKNEVGEEKKSAASPMSSDQSPASRHVPAGIKSSGAAFVKENIGNIKDFYKISKCIGRGKCAVRMKQSIWRVPIDADGDDSIALCINAFN